MKLIDEKIVDNALVYLNKETKCPLKEEQEVVIEEGIKYFKVSPRLYKLALKIERKSKRIQNNSLDPLVKKINGLANNFELLEDKYYLAKTAAEKTIIKVEYNRLFKEYSDILRMMRKSDIIDALRKVGALAFTVASMTIPYMAMQHFFPNVINSKDVSAFRYLKRAGAFVLCGIPVKALRTATYKFTDEAEAKVLARTDKLLKDTDVDLKDYSDEELHQM